MKKNIDYHVKNPEKDTKRTNWFYLERLRYDQISNIVFMNENKLYVPWNQVGTNDHMIKLSNNIKYNLEQDRRHHSILKTSILIAFWN